MSSPTSSSSRDDRRIVFHPFAHGVDPMLNQTMKKERLYFRPSSLRFDSTMYGTQSMNSYRPLRTKLETRQAQSMVQALKKIAHEPAKFKQTTRPRHWPRGRYEGREISDAEAMQIVRQEWRSGLAQAMVQARVNPQRHPRGPFAQRTVHGQVYIDS